MASTWPATLPQEVMISGASLGYGDALVEYQPQLGPSISRRGSSAVMRPLIGSMILSSAQVDAFETFFYTTLLSGSLPFNFPDPRTRATVLVKFTKATPPACQPLGADNFQLNLSLVVMP